MVTSLTVGAALGSDSAALEEKRMDPLPTKLRWRDVVAEARRFEARSRSAMVIQCWWSMFVVRRRSARVGGRIPRYFSRIEFSDRLWEDRKDT